jgi:hypothetical protein
MTLSQQVCEPLGGARAALGGRRRAPVEVEERAHGPATDEATDPREAVGLDVELAAAAGG